MDSRMLNVFHEDPFEGNFAKYDAEPNFWSANDDLQLTDTLNGILPIPPTDESLLSQKETQEQLQNSKNLLIYSDFVEQQLSDEANVINGQVYRAITDNEIDAEYRSVIIDSEDELTRCDDDDDDVQSQSTFRTRTDSSSIGDYESHSSDYDEDDEEETLATPVQHLLSTDATEFALQNERKYRTLSTNTVGSDADALGLNIDVNNFDLADFITKDDFALSLNTLRAKQMSTISLADVPKQVAVSTPVSAVKVAIKQPTIEPFVASKSRDSDYDSDSIIDVETVDVIDVDESNWEANQINDSVVQQDLCYVDNVKADPSWSPKPNKRSAAVEPKTTQMANKTVATAAVETTSTVKPKISNICLVPNKKQCDFLKRKISQKTASKTLTTKSKVLAKKTQEVGKMTVGKVNTNAVKTTAESAQINLNTGLGLGGKNLALLRHEHEAAASGTPTAIATPTPAPKRKLKLEEYKQRKSGIVTQVVKQTPAAIKPSNEVNTAAIPATLVTKTPPKTAVSSIVQHLKSPCSKEATNTPSDPITVAKNKVLRMLELKRAQQLKIIDSRINAKVPKVTKLPPLKELVKNGYCMESETEVATPTTLVPSKLNSNYEEIIIVSVSCNTDITLPPLQTSFKSTNSSRSLLKSSVLLYNMSGQKNLSNSLIASIQSEVVKQTKTEVTTEINEKVDKELPHGEDMVIMHLAKNRERKQMISISTQTELQPEFPMLTCQSRQSRERQRRSYRKRRTKVAANSAAVSAADSTDCSSLNSDRSQSNSNSTEGIAAGINCGGYSSRSTRRHRSSLSSGSSSGSESAKYERKQRQRQQRQRRTSYNKRRSRNLTNRSCSTSASEFTDHRARSRSPLRRSRSRSRSQSPSVSNRRGFVDRNVSQPAVEERRIVYVGRIEAETTKELLRRKFLPYGSIKQITIHYKENGMKYGFVTFERAQDAFTAIDTSPRDAQINMYDISFGGRRAFCRASYADLDNAGINNYQSYVFPKAAPVAAPQEDSFEALLLKVKAKLNAGKTAATTTTTTTGEEANGGATRMDCGNNQTSNAQI